MDHAKHSTPPFGLPSAKRDILWVDEILHHFETIAHHCLWVFPGEASRSCRWCRISSIHSYTHPSCLGFVSISLFAGLKSLDSAGPGKGVPSLGERKLGQWPGFRTLGAHQRDDLAARQVRRGTKPDGYSGVGPRATRFYGIGFFLRRGSNNSLVAAECLKSASFFGR